MGKRLLVAAVLLMICCAWVYAEDATNTTITAPPSSGVQTVRERIQFERELRQKCRESGDWTEYWTYIESKQPGMGLRTSPVAVSPQAAQNRLVPAATTTDAGGTAAGKTPAGIGEGQDGKQAEGETSLHDRLQAANQAFRDEMRALNDTWRQETKVFMDKLKALDKGDTEGRKTLIQAFVASLQERKTDVQELLTGQQETVQAIFTEYNALIKDKVAEGAEQSKEAKQKAIEEFNKRHPAAGSGNANVKTSGELGGISNDSTKVKGN